MTNYKSKFCSKKYNYHKIFGKDCNIARISLSIDSKVVSNFQIEFIYKIQNTGTIDFCGDYMICSKLFNKITGHDIIVTGQILEIRKIYNIPLDFQLEEIIESAKVYFKVSDKDWIVSNKFKDNTSNTNFGIILNHYIAAISNDPIQRIIIIEFSTTNASNRNAKNIELEYLVTEELTIDSFPDPPPGLSVRINERGNIMLTIPNFESKTTISYDVQFFYTKTGILNNYYVPIDIKATSNTEIIIGRIQSSNKSMIYL